MSKIYRIEVLDGDECLFDGPIGKYLKDRPELVAHRDEKGCIWECGPAPEGYHVEVSDEIGFQVYFAIRDDLTLADGETDRDLVFPPQNSYEWREGGWRGTLTYEEYAESLDDSSIPFEELFDEDTTEDESEPIFTDRDRY